MKMHLGRVGFALAMLSDASGLGAAGSPDAEALYATHCLSCHAPNRLGGMGPTLLPESLARLRKPDAYKAIAEGLPATQMPAFKEVLKPEEIKVLADWIYTPNKIPPRWDVEDIQASHIVNVENMDLPARPVFKADPTNVTLVVEHGDHHISVLDGDSMEPFHRFQTRYALHGGPKFTPDGRFVYWASRDGWITKYDLWNLKVVAEIRAGINTRNVAVSSDGRYVMVANYLPHTLVALSAKDLSLVQAIPVVAANGKSSRVSAVYDARPRHSFIAALKDIPEVWEIPYDGLSAYKDPVHENEVSAQANAGKAGVKPHGDGRSHHYPNRDVIPEPGPLPVRQIATDQILDDFFFDQDYAHLIGASRDNPRGEVIDLGAGRKIADLDIPGMPHLGSGITWDWTDDKGVVHPVMASPNLRDGHIQIIDMKTWKTLKVIPTAGPGFFLRSHENTPYAWADVFFGKNRDVMHVIDKRTLEIVADLRPEPGRTATHVEFDRYGKYALVSLWEMDGAIIVYDARTLKEIKRLPMKRPVGKYNVWNKTNLSAGTSH
ncbi:MAG TPA: cytochrome D1 domain-containing protein [Thiobacillaceae bacterium]|nr:cytochrome D1 domain-containing protein [Thiobacillaceae bacterium]HNU64107.1 cytochrome D1 domain-containing protein [Thiobacillaceae bacterium]